MSTETTKPPSATVEQSIANGQATDCSPCPATRHSQNAGKGYLSEGAFWAGVFLMSGFGLAGLALRCLALGIIALSILTVLAGVLIYLAFWPSPDGRRTPTTTTPHPGE